MKIGHGVLASALVSAGLLATACASSPPPPAGTKTAAQIVPAMEAAMKAASSVHISGTVINGSQTIGIDASLNGSDVSGTFSEDGTTFTLVVTSGKVYLQISAAYLKSAGLPAAACSTVCGKYLEVPAADVAKFTASLSMSALMNTMVKSIPSVTGDTTDLFKPATFEGQPVLQLIQATETADVARTGTPYPLFISSSATGSAHGSVTFSEWNAVPPVTTPPPSEIVTVSSL